MRVKGFDAFLDVLKVPRPRFRVELAHHPWGILADTVVTRFYERDGGRPWQDRAPVFTPARVELHELARWLRRHGFEINDTAHVEIVGVGAEAWLKVRTYVRHPEGGKRFMIRPAGVVAEEIRIVPMRSLPPLHRARAPWANPSKVSA